MKGKRNERDERKAHAPQSTACVAPYHPAPRYLRLMTSSATVGTSRVDTSLRSTLLTGGTIPLCGIEPHFARLAWSPLMAVELDTNGPSSCGRLTRLF